MGLIQVVSNFKQINILLLKSHKKHIKPKKHPKFQLFASDNQIHIRCFAWSLGGGGGGLFLFNTRSFLSHPGERRGSPLEYQFLIKLIFRGSRVAPRHVLPDRSNFKQVNILFSSEHQNHFKITWDAKGVQIKSTSKNDFNNNLILICLKFDTSSESDLKYWR